MELHKRLVEYRDDLARCARCSLCKYPPLAAIKSHRYSVGCPAIGRYGFHAYSAGGKIIIALALLEQRVSLSPDMVEVIYRCSTCGSCDVSCKYNRDLEPLEYIWALRAECFEQGLAPLHNHKVLLESIRQYNNVWNQPRARRDRWAKGLQVKDASTQKVEVLYYVGCTYSYHAGLQHVAHNTVKLMQKAGLTVGILGNEEVCCTSPAFVMGDRKLFTEVAQKNIDQWAATGARIVVTSCAGCYGLIKAKYPLVSDYPFEVLSAPELMDRLIQEKKLHPDRSLRRTITYHDPCHLGRQSERLVPWHGTIRKVLNQCVIQDPPKVFRRGTSGVYEAPRNVLNAIDGLELREMERIKEYAFCCGAGGGVKSAFPEMALWAATERIEEAKSTGADTLVTACPWCESNLQDAVLHNKSSISIQDFTTLLVEATGGV